MSKIGREGGREEERKGGRKEEADRQRERHREKSCLKKNREWGAHFVLAGMRTGDLLEVELEEHVGVGKLEVILEEQTLECSSSCSILSKDTSCEKELVLAQQTIWNTRLGYSHNSIGMLSMAFQGSKSSQCVYINFPGPTWCYLCPEPTMCTHQET